MNRQRGFTLLEVMVAILLMSIVSLIAWRGLDSVTRTDARLRENTEQTESLLRAFNQLERDVALRASIEMQEPDLDGDQNDRPQAPAAVSVRAADTGDFRLDVIRSAAVSGEGLQRVRWWLKDGTLYRAMGLPSDRYPLPAPKEGVAVLAGVVELQVRIWRQNGGWHTLDGNRENNPKGIEIRLTREAGQGKEQYRKVIGPLE
ncbi:type II secretion system minor pseudopilin GspJ [Pseudomonas viridiflava]|uniref:type II secretion system minor pseudopilin GspJ n=1 Tax=Pseudomonas viridiflava TaxID=33069 RepID=UPI0015E47BF1|nr:type II secretion system minor pseudopilin GspJ [Pseudomonas viridiflava]MBA1228656.1 type II secretion system minor pseudopilin GspJ [Pseudomonas viridiflava]